MIELLLGFNYFGCCKFLCLERIFDVELDFRASLLILISRMRFERFFLHIFFEQDSFNQKSFKKIKLKWIFERLVEIFRKFHLKPDPYKL